MANAINTIVTFGKIQGSDVAQYEEGGRVVTRFFNEANRGYGNKCFFMEACEAERTEVGHFQQIGSIAFFVAE